MYSITPYRHIFDTDTSRRIDMDSWEELLTLLYTMHKEDHYKNKKDATLISSAVYKDGCTRANDNVLHWSRWCALDIDEFPGSVEEIKDLAQGYAFAAYSTASCREDKLKFRLILPLTSTVRKDDIPAFWNALNTKFIEVLDAQCKDQSRMFYVPGQYEGAFNFFTYEDGPFVDPHDLMSEFPFVRKESDIVSMLGDDVKSMLVKHRVRKTTDPCNTITWTSWRDCPFVNKKAVEEYAQITDTGWYRKLYSIMVGIAAISMKKGYPISEFEIAQLAVEIHNDYSKVQRPDYDKRNFLDEARRALNHVLTKG